MAKSGGGWKGSGDMRPDAQSGKSDGPSTNRGDGRPSTKTPWTGSSDMRPSAGSGKSGA